LAAGSADRCRTVTGLSWEARRYENHPGVDLAAPAGTPITASGAGRVTSAGWASKCGNYTCIQHTQSKSCYGRQSQILVGVGDAVHAGQKSGAVGSTGNSTGPHLHFECRHNGSVRCPASYVGITPPSKWSASNAPGLNDQESPRPARTRARYDGLTTGGGSGLGSRKSAAGSPCVKPRGCAAPPAPCRAGLDPRLYPGSSQSSSPGATMPTPTPATTASARRGRPVELGRYAADTGQRVLIGKRSPRTGCVALYDIPLGQRDPRFVVEARVDTKAELDAIVADYLTQARKRGYCPMHGTF
jgi:Peptidase family M23